MAIVMSQDGMRWALSLVQQQLRFCSLHLFVNDFDPPATMVRTDFTEPSWDGYQPFTFSLWGNVFLGDDGNAQTDFQAVYFAIGALGGADTVYGYFVTNQLGYVVFAERDPLGGVSLSGPGAVYPIVPRFSAGQLC